MSLPTLPMLGTAQAAGAVGERPVGNQKAALHNPLERLSFCALSPTPGTGLDHKLNQGRVVAAKTPQTSQDLPASPSPGMNAQVCNGSSFSPHHLTFLLDLLQHLTEHCINSAKQGGGVG